MAKADWITTAAAATMSGYHVDYIRKIARAGHIKAQKWASDWQVSRSSLQGYMRNKKKLGERRGPKPSSQSG